MALSPQLEPTDYAELETIEDRGDREHAFAENSIYRHEEPQGTRYTKGTSRRAEKRSWQSLDVILRSDAASSAALPRRELRISRVFTALTVAAAILTVAGTAASAREGLDLSEINGPGAVLLGGGLATVGFGITAGVFYGKTKKGYERAVDIYNDSLGMRLGVLDAQGQYVPPAGTIVDEEGFVVLDQREVGPQPPPKKANPEPPSRPAPPAENDPPQASSDSSPPSTQTPETEVGSEPAPSSSEAPDDSAEPSEASQEAPAVPEPQIPAPQLSLWPRAGDRPSAP